MKHLRHLVLVFLALALGAALAPQALALDPGSDVPHLDILDTAPQILAAANDVEPWAMPRAPFGAGPFLQPAERSVRTMVRCTRVSDWCSIRGHEIHETPPSEALVRARDHASPGRTGALRPPT